MLRTETEKDSGQFPDFSENQLTVLQRRYLAKEYGLDGEIISQEDPDQLFHRVSKAVAGAEKEEDRPYWEERFYQVMRKLEFLPNSPTLMNAGRELGMLSACVTADTVIHTLAGPKPVWVLLQEGLKEFQVYSCDPEGGLQVGTARNLQLTRKQAEVVRIRFDDGSDLRVTPDHLIMMRDGTYREAGSLLPWDSVMPFSVRYSPEYVWIKDHVDDGFKVPAHQWVGVKHLGLKSDKEWIIHHENGDEWDNRPENLSNFRRGAHTHHHNPWTEDRRRKASLEFQTNNPMFSPEAQRKISEGMQGNQRAVGAVRTEEHRQAISNYWTGRTRPPETIERMRKAAQEREARRFRERYNHKVVSVEPAGREDVYDLSVDNWHNFAANGVFVHNCFVLPVGDSIEEIFQAVKNTALIHKSGGGTGFFFGDLRPEGSIVGSTGGVASGPCSFIRAFDAATDVVKQGGTRRGANMGILQVDHPDILKFIHLKENGGLENFNISVSVTDRFIEAVRKGADYPLVDPRDGRPVGSLNAQVVWEEICRLAWKTGDPGVWFVDRVNGTNWNSHLGEIKSPNPCGEQELLPYESCNLGSINLARIQQLQELDPIIETAVRLLDNVIDVNKYPLKEIEERTRSTRRIGVGVMGWADYLIERNIPYDSSQALKEAQKLGKYIRRRVYTESVKLAGERGEYPEARGQYSRMRNTSPLTIAPTGTISMIGGVSSGIEPIFACGYAKTVMDSTRLIETNVQLRKILEERGLWTEEVEETITQTGSIQSIEGIPDNIKRVFQTASEIGWRDHVQMQAAWQQNTDNAVSKTINMANTATEENIGQAYLLAHELGCKGITVYRDGSKDIQVLTVGTKKEENKADSGSERPVRLDGYTEKVRTGHGNIYITLNHLHGHLFEVFATQGKAGGCDSAQMEAVTRLVTLCIRKGVPLDSIINQLQGITCCPAFDNGDMVRSGPDAVSLALKRFSTSHRELPDHNRVFGQKGEEVGIGGRKCPDCNGRVISQEGCSLCLDCGWNRCD